MSEATERLGFLQRRKLGLTVPKLVAAARRAHEKGDLNKDDDPAAQAAAIAMELRTEDPQAYAEVSAVDWEAILAFIEKLLPIILQLIALFS